MNKITLRNTDWLALILVFLPFSRIIKFIPEIPVLLCYGGLFAVGTYLLTKRGNVFNKKAIFFIIFCGISIVVNYVDARYRAWERLFSLFCIILAVGPLFANDTTRTLRENCLKYACWLSIIICIISFVLFFTARPLTYTERGNLYGGITVHSMVLGPLAGVALLYSLQYFLSKQRMLKFWEKICWISVCIICLFNCVMPGSRSALLSMIAAAVLWLWFYLADNRKLFFKYLTVITLVTVSSSPLWWQYTETIQRKMAYAESRGSVLTSRQAKWENRIREIQEKPVFGLGFCTVSSPVAENGNVEPGNGWLFIWSSSGIFAFLLFCMIYWDSIRESIKAKNSIGFFTFALLIFFAIHLNAEGYSISSGHVLCFMMWLCFGIAFDFKLSS